MFLWPTPVFIPTKNHTVRLFPGAMGEAWENVRGGAARGRATGLEVKEFIRVIRGCSRHEDADGGGEHRLKHLK